MIDTRFFYLFLLCFTISISSSAQIEKGKCNLGFSAAPLFELNSTGLNGVLINLDAHYSFSNRFIFGVQPYYALTNEKMKYAFDLITMQPRGVQKDVFRSMGINSEFKFVLLKTKLFTPYSIVLLGVGYSQYHLYQSNVFGELAVEDQLQLMNYNLGIGLGTYYSFSGHWHLDVKVMYTDAYDNKNMDLSSYVYPSVGLVRSF